MKLSSRWKNWVAMIDDKICEPCKDKHGKIYEISKDVSPSKLHPHCRNNFPLCQNSFYDKLRLYIQ